MPIMLPLTLVGFGYLIYQLFTGAALALPIAIGVAAGVAASQHGCSPFVAFFLGVIAFTAVVMASQLAALKLSSPYARMALVALFAVPAALTGFSFAHALGVLVGTSGIVTGLVAAAACAAIAAHRLWRTAL